ncbi:uncharacterized protein KY384_000109 [Bacidia gigantensis]|uniref:uncharacterized protein n=1 Tax=Bacidia gigantensis TaxID=2732470 RepID=UPI001D042C8B|nr:uncharacterized protein KY384_000109 [Bacidia gigantensis]KAG8526116.1 hypothetical protein KY384_000109 [Bacidia gigantensis]
MNDAPDTPMSSSPPDSAPSRDVLPYPQHPACGQGPNSCAAIAWDTMTALETCTGAGISSESFTNPYAYAWTDDHDLQAGTLDEILRVNQRAITRIFEMLQCTCARKPDMAMLLGSIITKILAWHRRACSKSGDLDPYLPVDPLFPHPSGTTTPMSSQSSTGVNSPYRKRPWDHENMETINPAILSKLSAEPVRVGKFVPDDEVQGPIRRLLILSNLKKVRPMIDCLGRLSETYEDNASKNLFTMLRMWLREELSRTVKDVCQRTSVTDVGLISACG